jgi:GNAT superfamily N-acetyltransferase
MRLWQERKEMTDLSFHQRLVLTNDEIDQLRLLWNKEYPVNLKNDHKQFINYLSNLEYCHHVLVLKNNAVVGWYFDFDREGSRWFAMILDDKIQGKGVGTSIIQNYLKPKRPINGWVIDKDDYLKEDGNAYRSPLEFYHKNGCTVLDEERLELPHLSAVKIMFP